VLPSEPVEAFVWIWLPGSLEPVVAGVLERRSSVYTFEYAESYLARHSRISLYLPELPLEPGILSPLVGEVAGCIRDSGPDSWGQRVIENRLVGRGTLPVNGFGLLTNLLESGSDRIGALDFQSSPYDYVARTTGKATLDELVEAAALVEAGEPLPPALDEALLQGTLIGGARPKAVLVCGDRQLIAKFSSSSDPYPVVRAEFVAMELAQRAGLDVAPVEITSALGKDVLLVERFDRPPTGARRAIVSALTILGLDAETEGWYATYPDLADQIRARFADPERYLRELFSRITFNVLVSNTDDHARNHAAFWDGATLTLTPAYDLTPSQRSGGEATQAMAIGRDGYKLSQLAGCVERSSEFLLSEAQAREIIDHQLDVINADWEAACDLGGLTTVERRSMWGRQFINPFAVHDY